MAIYCALILDVAQVSYWPALRSATTLSGSFALQRLRHAVDAAAGLGDLAHVDGRDLDAARLELADQRLARRRRDHPVLSQRHELAAARNRVLERYVDDLVALALQPVDDAGLGAGEADGGELFGDRHHHGADMDVIFVHEC